MTEYLEVWQTPLSAKGGVMLELLDRADADLAILFEELPVRGTGLPGQRIWFRCEHRHVLAYQNRDEGYHTRLVPLLRAAGGSGRATYVMRDSDWYRALVSREWHIEANWSGAVHYLFYTDDDVVEVLASRPPAIEFVSDEPSSLAPPAG